jgi:hypothetical protein
MSFFFLPHFHALLSQIKTSSLEWNGYVLNLIYTCHSRLSQFYFLIFGGLEAVEFLAPSMSQISGSLFNLFVLGYTNQLSPDLISFL